MKIARFEMENRRLLGALVDGDRLIDLSPSGAAGTAHGDLVRLIEDGPEAWAAVEKFAAGSTASDAISLSDARLLAPIPRPGRNVFCVGRNYKEHVEEGYRVRGTETKLPEFPQFFTKPPSAVIGPDEDVLLDTAVTERLDYEGELAVIVGKSGGSIRREDALDHVFGYSIVNDVTARDLQRRHDQWFKGKALDTCCPMGPVVVRANAIGDAQALDISTRINGETRQASNTRMMIFDVPTIIEQLSAGLTLEVGDIIATGTPSGVGYAMEPPHFLADGDVMEITVQGIGTLRNVVRRIG